MKISSHTVSDYLEDMATFTTLAAIDCFCNINEAGLGENLSRENYCSSRVL